MDEREEPALWTPLVVLGLAVVAAAGLYFFWGRTDSLNENTPIDTSAPRQVLGVVPGDWTVVNLEGKEVQARAFRGKVVFLNQWATWCGYCVREMPSIDSLYRSLQGSDVAFVIVSDEPLKTVKAFVKKQGWSLPIYVSRERVPQVLQTEGIPATYIVNRRGEVIFKHLGPKDWNTDSVRALLRKVS